MRKLILFLTTSTILMSIPVISSERDFELSNENHYQLQSSIYDGFYDTIPDNPNVFESITRFEDMNLTTIAGKLEPNQKFKIVNLSVNDNLQPVFQLSDDTYVLASQYLIFDDIILEHFYQEESFWINKGFVVQTSPIGNQAKTVSKIPTPYTKVKITETVITPRGRFSKLPEGWVSSEFLSSEDNRMEQVQELLNQKYDHSEFGIYVHQIDTGFTAGVNQNKMMYTASVAKLPVLYYAQKGLDQGNLDLKDSYKYVQAVHDFEGAYLPEGSGSLSKEPDNKNYSLEELIRLTAQKSDNVASNVLAYYISNQFDKNYYKTVDVLTGKKWDMSTKDGTPEMAGRLMVALYDLNSSGIVLEHLSQTDFDDQRISKTIDVKVAHKIGDAYDFRHDVALVYTDSPFVIAIFTNNKTYDDISAIASDVYRILK